MSRIEFWYSHTYTVHAACLFYAKRKWNNEGMNWDKMGDVRHWDSKSQIRAHFDRFPSSCQNRVDVNRNSIYIDPTAHTCYIFYSSHKNISAYLWMRCKKRPIEFFWISKYFVLKQTVRTGQNWRRHFLQTVRNKKKHTFYCNSSIRLYVTCISHAYFDVLHTCCPYIHICAEM